MTGWWHGCTGRRSARRACRTSRPGRFSFGVNTSTTSRSATPCRLGQSHAYPRARPAPAWGGLHRTDLDVGQHDERRHHAAVRAARDKTWTLNKKPGALHQLAVTDAAQSRHSFLQALDRLSCAVRNRLELV